MNTVPQTVSRPPAVTPARRRMRRVLARVILLASVLGIIGLAGFLAFIWSLPQSEVRIDERADGLVVLTGGASRIEDGLELLAAGRAGRMLITGVNRTTRAEDLVRHVPEAARLLECCVDVDKAAMNTTGNALEARRWANAHGYSSLIVVTSAYHMPRALTEFAHVMPQTRLLAFPVITPAAESEHWWRRSSTIRLLFGEYLKYVVAKLRISLTSPPALAGPARPAP